ncbi:MAG: hypothetical protein KF780_12340 [Sphingomonas sp.]|nr:hypothetical protein [Sphingomonas sp.]
MKKCSDDLDVEGRAVAEAIETAMADALARGVPVATVLEGAKAGCGDFLMRAMGVSALAAMVSGVGRA